MNMKPDSEILFDFAKTRNLSHNSMKSYRETLKIYTKFHKSTIYDLLNEADKEEEQGIRWKNRKLKDRLITFKIFLQEKYLESTYKSHFQRITTFYKHHEIEIHTLPHVSDKNLNKQHPITFNDLPDKKIIKQALKLTNPLMRALILFMSSSGCARKEALSLKISDFIDATKNYHKSDNIYEVIKVLKDHDDIVPMFRLKRHKTNKYYYTFCSPEAVNEIINYLLTINKKIINDRSLFKINIVYMNENFKNINNNLNLGKVGSYNRFRSHMLRKFHASALYNNGMNLEHVDALQGRSKDSTHSAYFMENPEELRQTYIDHMNAITINLDVNNLDMKSSEYIKQETELNKAHEENRSYQEQIDDMNRRIDEIASGDFVLEKESKKEYAEKWKNY